MTYLYIIIFCFLIFYVFIFILKHKINLLEKKIISLFSKRNNLIASIYEITKNDFIRHDEIFKEILRLKRISFLETKINSDIQSIIYTQKLIHNELDFIFNITDKHPKLSKNFKFLYIKDILIEQSDQIWKKLDIYKNIILKYNYLIFIKNITILWLLIPFKKLDNL